MSLILGAIVIIFGVSGFIAMTNPNLITNHFYHWIFDIAYEKDKNKNH